jgi:hypothetical protein
MNKFTLTALVTVITLCAVLASTRAFGRIGTNHTLAADAGASTGPSGQTEALADGGVTFEEYQAGFLAMTDCLAQAGWIPEQPSRLTTRQVYEYWFYVPDPGDMATPHQRERWAAALVDCRTAHFDGVQRVWELKMTMSEAERQQARDYLGACMRGRGLGASDHPTEDDMVNLVRVQPGRSSSDYVVFKDCLKETQSRFDLRRAEVP